jgi:hypothetical protein
LKLLGRHRPPAAATVIKVLERARAAGDYERLEPPKAEAGAPGGGAAGPGLVNQTTLRAFPALFETAVVELGRLGDPEASRELIRVLKDASGPGRVEAALALGNLQASDVFDALLAALDDGEPWVRYAAYRSLKTLSGEQHFANWLLGAKAERAEAVSAWKEWRKKKASVPRRSFK